MITEDYCDFEISELLNKKCFSSEDCHTAYDEDGEFFWYGDYSKDRHGVIDAPTIQQAMKWLRKKYNLHIIALPYAPIDRPPYHPGEADIVYIAQIFKGIIPFDEIGRSIIKLSPEEVYKEAIRYCLTNLNKFNPVTFEQLRNEFIFTGEEFMDTNR